MSYECKPHQVAEYVFDMGFSSLICCFFKKQRKQRQIGQLLVVVWITAQSEIQGFCGKREVDG
jgi:hypothetical protein